MSNVESLTAFNALEAGEAERELLTCCASGAFARYVAALRPYRDLAQLTAVADATVRDLDWEDVSEALKAHLRIGERAGGADREASWSRQEQSGVQDHLREALAEGNHAYEDRFGHVYLVCATGLSGEEMLTRLRDRLVNDEEAERAIVRNELAKITRLRMAKLVGA
ncbi:2-oxo-4-hydroxy-4-carboxy-5-ureidoimidazoline decarboxylase [Nonomuraea sp. NPDC050556]|uniref:2-oxo-4-hydroxy-4-carboxy-5-ureidoimidazoline decarboxylase n=1 Tax=Nonomuraea sp. NPDC050556 TaxID=3364369 RepID=UPI003788505B